MIISLIGYRGCGKSSVAPLLAKRLHCESADSDDVIETRAGKSIRQIFSDDGEAAFRDLETQVLANLLQRDPIVVSAGGGAVLAEINRQRMRQAGPVVWLQASAEILAERIARDATSGQRRPALTGDSAVREVSDVLAVRLPLYAATATLTVDSEQLSPAEIVEQILSDLNSGIVAERET
ncbi:MAG: shikimate kinase [Planctomycetaceae bacterium]